MVFLSTSFDRPTLLAIRVDGTGDVTKTHLSWSTAKAAPHTPSPLLIGENLFMISDNGTTSCLNARTGQVHWQERIGGNFSASPVYADGKIYSKVRTASRRWSKPPTDSSTWLKVNSTNAPLPRSPSPMELSIYARKSNFIEFSRNEWISCQVDDARVKLHSLRTDLFHQARLN